MSASTAIGLSRPNSAATVAARAVLNATTNQTPPRPQSPPQKPAIESKGNYGTSGTTESKKADLIPNFEGPLGNIYKYAAPLLAQSTNLYWQIKNALECKTPGLPKPTPSQISQYEENIKNLILRSSTILEKTFNLKTQARIDQPDISATEKRKLFDALYKLLIDDKNLIDKLRTYLRTPIITPPAPTTTQRSESSSDSSEDEKTPPNTPARPTAKPTPTNGIGGDASSADIEFSASDIALLRKITNGGTLKSLSKTYIGDMDPNENMEKHANKMVRISDCMKLFSKNKTTKNALLLAEEFNEILDIYRRFFSYYDYSSQLNKEDKEYISDKIEHLTEDLNIGRDILDITGRLLPKENQLKLTEEIDEFKRVVKEVNSRVSFK
jgi:hypothetical protein